MATRWLGCLLALLGVGGGLWFFGHDAVRGQVPEPPGSSTATGGAVTATSRAATTRAVRQVVVDDAMTGNALHQPQGFAAPSWASETLDHMKRLGFKVPDDMRLPDDNTWDQLRVTWEGMCRELNAAKSRYQATGMRLGADGLAKGAYEEFFAADYPPVPEGTRDTRPWTRRQPDDWKTVQCTYDPIRATQVYRVVRIVPGAAPELDEAREQVKALTQLRQMEVARFLTLHESVTGRKR